MLLVHQAGSVKVGEVVRYTLTYTPSNDRILPTPSHLHVRVKNSSAIPLRAAWVHGPYALHVAAYPATFNPHQRVERPERDGVPAYEPMVKAGGSWSTKLLVPESIRETGADLGRKRRRSSGPPKSDTAESSNHSVTWIVEITSQILFSNSASVNFEMIVGRDEKSLHLGSLATAGHSRDGPAQVKDFLSEDGRRAARKKGNVQTSGVYSNAVVLVVEDTATLWDQPPLPSWEDQKTEKGSTASATNQDNTKKRKRKKIHLIIVTHGLHGNVGADLLFLKESIDATVKQARIDAKKRKESYNGSQRKKAKASNSETDASSPSDAKQDENDVSTAPLSGGQEDLDNTATDNDDDDEETIVRGFPGNAVRTENGIQYLGKRLAKYILRFTYPDQPFLPVKRNLTRALTESFKSDADKTRRDGNPAHQGSSVHNAKQAEAAENLPYTFSSISFVGHSLGGLIQTYAVAYIHKHSPGFFQQVQPINFICMASPMLGLSNENPLYVKFALDFGLVGRTGQDLGLTWRPPAIAKGGWNAMVGGFSSGQKEKSNEEKQSDPSAKPLLRVLPTGPAHQVLRMFRNRTVYSNVVNDGIVPLRTSCLLFLDWRGLGKVDKARRENGLIGTVAEWGWAELTGTNASSVPPRTAAERDNYEEEDEANERVQHGQGTAVPQPAENETTEDNNISTNRMSYEEDPDERNDNQIENRSGSVSKSQTQQDKGMFNSFLNFFRSGSPDRAKTPPPPSKKTTKAILRGQTIRLEDDQADGETANGEDSTTANPTIRPEVARKHTGQTSRPRGNRSDSYMSTNSTYDDLQAPPKTSIFESAGDILNPPLPNKAWITDPGNRARTIFHDRVYHPEDIPAPPVKYTHSRRYKSLPAESLSKFSSSSSKSLDQSIESNDTFSMTDNSGMKVEEKIARAYHRDLSWRKVLVRLEPDAHNNMIVRRMFANAYGWPVIKHLCDTHFADTYTAVTRDEEEPARERAKPMEVSPDPATGEEVEGQTAKELPDWKWNEMREARDELADLSVSQDGARNTSSQAGSSQGTNRPTSSLWDDEFFAGSDDEDSDMVDGRNLVQRLINPHANSPKTPEPVHQRPEASRGSNEPGSVTPVVSFTDGHRGLAPISPTAPRTPSSMKSPASIKPTFDTSNIERVASGPLVEEPTPLPTSPRRTAEMGLRKSVDEQFHKSGRAKRTGSGLDRMGSSQY